MVRKVILDCDPGIDDSLAIMLALSCEELEVVGITIVCGNTPVELGFENAKRVLKHMNRLDIPIYVGADKPLVKPFVNALDTHGRDGLGESFLDAVDGYEQNINAVQFLSTILKQDSISILALGPLTNLAHLIDYDPQAFASIDELISMGGNYKSHGNCSPVAEYNYWCDSDAASKVYEHASKINKKITMVGLDVTREIVLTPNLLTYLNRLHPTHGAFIQAITKFYFDFHWEWEHIIGCVINDPLVIAYFINKELCEGFTSFVQIEPDGLTRGQSIVDAYDFYKQKHNALILTKVDALAFFQFFFSKILQYPIDKLSLLPDLM